MKCQISPLVFQSPSAQLLPLDTQGHGGDVEEYDDTANLTADDDDGQDHDHQTIGDQIDDVFSKPTGGGRGEVYQMKIIFTMII